MSQSFPFFFYRQKKNVVLALHAAVRPDATGTSSLPSKRKGYTIVCLAKVAELVDALDLGSSAFVRGGSSPPFRTIKI